MQRNSIVIGIYATLVMTGGLIGFLVAKSLVSLIVAGIVALLLFACAYLVWKGHQRAFDAAIAILFCLLVFFGYRFSISYQIAPAGIMTLISGGVLGYLIKRKQSAICEP
jgi:uncharacterized membrane protein (UPF0136 family)